MKKLLLIVCLAVLFDMIAVTVSAEPYLVCDPQSDATGYVYKLNGGAEVTVPYATQVFGGQMYAVIADLTAVPVGVNAFEVKAYREDANWGRLESAIVPFSFTRPVASGAPGNVVIKR